MGYNFVQVERKGSWGEGGEPAGNVSEKGMVFVEAVPIGVCEDPKNLIHRA
jgi:hypothetical protein